MHIIILLESSKWQWLTYNWNSKNQNSLIFNSINLTNLSQLAKLNSVYMFSSGSYFLRFIWLLGNGHQSLNWRCVSNRIIKFWLLTPKPSGTTTWTGTRVAWWTGASRSLTIIMTAVFCSLHYVMSSIICKVNINKKFI